MLAFVYPPPLLVCEVGQQNALNIALCTSANTISSTPPAPAHAAQPPLSISLSVHPNSPWSRYVRIQKMSHRRRRKRDGTACSGIGSCMLDAVASVWVDIYHSVFVSRNTLQQVRLLPIHVCTDEVRAENIDRVL
jgi:hypothetical protein